YPVIEIARRAARASAREARDRLSERNSYQLLMTLSEGRVADKGPETSPARCCFLRIVLLDSGVLCSDAAATAATAPASQTEARVSAAGAAPTAVPGSPVNFSLAYLSFRTPWW